MPKIVDHDARRREIITTVWRLIAEEGIGAVTSRRIAEETGQANGVLLYYFRNKDEMLHAAYQYVFDATNDRFGPSEEHHGLTGLRTMCLEIMPLDEVRLMEARIAMTFWQQAIHASEHGRVHDEFMRLWREDMSRFLDEAKAAEAIDADVDIARTVDLLMNLLTGMQVMAVLSPEDTTSERQLAMLDDFFVHHFGAGSVASV